IQTITQFKDHPAILGWIIGNEWNINQGSGGAITPFYCYNNIADAIDGVERTLLGVPGWTSGIKELDPDHIVTSSLGFIQTHYMNGGFMDLFITGEYADIINALPDVDLWGFNVYRGNSLNTFFAQWREAFPNKPLMLTEFGTDAYNTVAGAVDEQQQADNFQSLWREIFRNLSAHDPARQAVGGFAFEWNDEWWKHVDPANHDSGGFPLVRDFPDMVRGNGPNNINQVTFYGHPDAGWSNEEYYGLLDLFRVPRIAYSTLDNEYSSMSVPAENITLAARSQTGDPGVNSHNSYAVFYKNGEPLSLRYATEGGGVPVARGFNIMVIDKSTGTPKDLKSFDMWEEITDPDDECARLLDYVQDPQKLAPGDIVMVAVADTGTPLGESTPSDCQIAITTYLGGTQINSLNFNEPYLLISEIIDQGNALNCYEEVGTTGNVTIDGSCNATLPAISLP
ncbi:MAG: hypothetical protein K8I00_02080, partial [Candidatus Omnitrophica bacterium]|nr:hypothetical protein [Candidatus Omnitrophota bacterium]